MRILRKLFRRAPKPLPSILHELSSQLTVNQLSAVLRMQSDSRMLVQAAASFIGVSEEVLMKRIAHHLRFRFVEAIPPMPLQVIERYTRLEVLEKAGAVLMITGRKITAICCTEPLCASALIETIPQAEICLTTRTSIEECLENTRLATYSSQNSSASSQAETITNQLISLLIQQIAPYEASQCDIILEENSPRYEFKTAANKTGVGSIRACSCNELLCFVDKIIHQQNGKTAIGGKEISFCRKSLNRVAINWKEAPQIEAPQFIEPDLSTQCCQEKSDSQSSKISTPRLLLVDDNEEFGNVLSLLFRKNGFNVDFLPSATRALEYLAHTPNPSLVVCDVHMPIMNGFSFLKAFRAHNPHTPVLMLTSDENDETQAQLLHQGADGFIGKSEHPTVLFAHVQRLLTRPLGQPVEC